MEKIARINAKIEQIERLLADIRDQLDAFSKESGSQPKRGRKGEPLPSEEEWRAEYQRMYGEFVAKDPKAIEDYIKARTKVYLNAFCKTNGLPIDANKLRKDMIASEVMKWMAQRKAITK